jgi:hypothetical protein
MPSTAEKVTSTVLGASSASLIGDFKKIEEQFPNFAAAFKLVALTACADAVGNDNRSRGNFLTDVGANISQLMIHAALQVIPNRALGEKIAGQLNASWELRAAKEALVGGKYEQPRQIDFSALFQNP